MKIVIECLLRFELRNGYVMGYAHGYVISYVMGI
jgi:hypothetical protein